jgi:hypothetical protein
MHIDTVLSPNDELSRELASRLQRLGQCLFSRCFLLLTTGPSPIVLRRFAVSLLFGAINLGSIFQTRIHLEHGPFLRHHNWSQY